MKKVFLALIFCVGLALAADAEQAAPAEQTAQAPEGVGESEAITPPAAANPEQGKPEEGNKSEVAQVSPSMTGDGTPAIRPEFRCEICMMVALRKLQRHTLCDGLETKQDSDMCREVVETLTVYDRYVVDWLYGDGCQRLEGGEWNDVKPCPAHVICSWMLKDFGGARRTFCQFEDHRYRRSPDFHTRHHIVSSSSSGALEAGKSEDSAAPAEPAMAY